MHSAAATAPDIRLHLREFVSLCNSVVTHNRKKNLDLRAKVLSCVVLSLEGVTLLDTRCGTAGGKLVMRFLIAMFGTILMVGGVCVAQDPPPTGGFVPRVRHNRPVFPPPSVPSETPALPPNQAGFPAGQQQMRMAQLPATAQPIQRPAVNPPTPAPPPASGPTPVPPSPGEAQAQLNLPPPTPPQVTYRDGQLTVQALNSTLGSVLIAIRNKTGMQFEGLDAASERVVVAMGPAPEGEVLAAILSGSHFDFIAIDRPDSPGIVQRVILTPRAGGSAPAVAAAAGSGSGEEEEVADDDPDNLRAPEDTPARPPLMQAQPIPPANPQPQPNPGTTTIPTPEQLKEQIQQIEQRRQQTQQPPGSPQKVPQ